MALRIHTINHKHILILLAVIVVALLIPASAALGDDDPEEYEPGGVGTLFQGVDLREGQDPTLYEKYPDSAWQMDWKSKGWTNFVDNTVDPVLNGIANTLMGVTKAVTHASIAFSWQMSDFDAFSLLSDDMTDMISAVANSAIDWLMPTCLAIGAVLVLIKMNLGTGDGLRQFGALFLTAIVGVSLAMIPQAWTGGIDAIRQVGSQTTAAATQAATTEVDTPFAGPAPTFGNDEGTNSHRIQGDAIWRTYVATPWCIAEFGNLNTCQDFGEEVLSRSGEDRTDYLDDAEFKDAVGGDDSAAWQMATGQDGATRMAIMLPALLVAVIFCGLVIFLNAAVLLYLMLALMLLVVGVFFAMMWVIPGKPRQWGMQWAEKLFGFTFMSFIANLILMVTMLVAMTTMGLTGSYGWGVAAMLTIVGSVASLLLFRHLKEIMGVGATGVMGAMATGAATGMMAGRAWRGVKSAARRIPRPDTSNGVREHTPLVQKRTDTAQSPSAPRPTGQPSAHGRTQRAAQTGSHKPNANNSKRRRTPAPTIAGRNHGTVMVATGSPRLPQGPTATGGQAPGPGHFAHGPGYQPVPGTVPNGSNANIDGAQALVRETSRVAAMRGTPSANAPQPGPRIKPGQGHASQHSNGPESSPAPTKPQPGQPQPAPDRTRPSQPEPRRPRPPAQGEQSKPAASQGSQALPGLEGPDQPQDRPRRRRSMRKDNNDVN